jgi:glucokinase
MEAMQKMVQRALRKGEHTNLIWRLRNREHFSPQLLAEEALRGDSVALHVYCEVARWIGAATIKYVNIYNPDVLILGGEVLQANELVIANVRSSLMTQAMEKTDNMFKVVSTSLGLDAALVGVVSSYFHK